MADGDWFDKGTENREACVSRAIRFGYGLFAVSFGAAYFAQQFAFRKMIPTKYQILFPATFASLLAYFETRRRTGLC